ncbi:MAG: hypothetical protein CME71_11750 [Halobacteriovorax sp.]|nr:hypothetical protein [Halobacteriovorax sp.]|tara:strand:+ start:545 stop:781 length:237 start_codon:yes stop_codon:yes gene_type:complete
MTFEQALEIASGCGLSTVEEAVKNIDIHATQMFAYDTLQQEFDELFKTGAEDYYRVGETPAKYSSDTSISIALWRSAK